MGDTSTAEGANADPAAGATLSSRLVSQRRQRTRSRAVGRRSLRACRFTRVLSSNWRSLVLPRRCGGFPVCVRRIHRRRAVWRSRWRDLVWEKQGHRGREIATNLDDVFVSRAIAYLKYFLLTARSTHSSAFSLRAAAPPAVPNACSNKLLEGYTLQDLPDFSNLRRKPRRASILFSARLNFLSGSVFRFQMRAYTGRFPHWFDQLSGPADSDRSRRASADFRQYFRR